ncbi:MAG: hypothetical protein JWO42_1700 [Chloroflexi bacterium]|nr:hypothetical protein [Chloroflexota bacterium]
MIAKTREGFDELLNDFRRAAGLTQAALAERAGVSVRGIQALERGDNRPQRDTMRRLAIALGLNEEERARFAAVATPGPRRRAPSGLALVPHALSALVPPGAAEHGSVAAMSAGRLVPFVGRVRDLDLLKWHLAGDGPPLRLLAGEPGIGKTRMLQAMAGQAVAQGLTVLVGGCHRRGAQEPYAPLLSAVERHIAGLTAPQRRVALHDCAWLVHLLPELAADFPSFGASAALPPEQERRLMFRAVGRYLANVAGPAGTLLVLDDLQWAGTDALDLLMTLVRTTPEAPPLRALGAYRDSELGPRDPLAVLLADLAHSGLAAHQPLGPLAPTEAAQLLRGLLPDGEGVGQAEKEHMLQQAGGVPFFLVSYAQWARSRPADAARDGVPWGLQYSVRQRMAGLSDATRTVLGLVAVIGRDMQLDVLREIAGPPEEMVYAALEEACRSRLLVDEQQSYRFAHDVIREVVEADLGASRRERLHGRVAVSLERMAQERGQALPVETLAYHHARSNVHAAADHFHEQAVEHPHERRTHERRAHAATQAHLQEAAGRLDQPGSPLDVAHARSNLELASRWRLRHRPVRRQGTWKV